MGKAGDDASGGCLGPSVQVHQGEGVFGCAGVLMWQGPSGSYQVSPLPQGASGDHGGREGRSGREAVDPRWPAAGVG
jgi:hypothetical protein